MSLARRTTAAALGAMALLASPAQAQEAAPMTPEQLAIAVSDTPWKTAS